MFPMSKTLKNKDKVKAAVALFSAGVRKGSTLEIEIRKMGFKEGIRSRSEMMSFVKNVTYNLEREKHMRRFSTQVFEDDPYDQCSFPISTAKTIAIVLFVVFVITLFTGFIIITEPDVRACVTLYKTIFSDAEFEKSLRQN